MSKTDNAEDNFLGRWSRRKQQSKVEFTQDEGVPLPNEESLLETDLEAGTAELPATDQLVVAEDAVDEKILTDEDMVPIESLNADSDYSPFFSEGVSRQLRNMALKKLFFSGKFAFRDGLDDYDDDFTHFEPLGNTVTSDMKFHQRRKEKARLAKLEEERLEEERRLAAESEDKADSQEEAESSEATDPASDTDQPQDTIENPNEEDLSDTQIEITDHSSEYEKTLEDQEIAQNAATVAASKNLSPEQTDHRQKHPRLSADDSNNTDCENT